MNGEEGAVSSFKDQTSLIGFQGFDPGAFPSVAGARGGDLSQVSSSPILELRRTFFDSCACLSAVASFDSGFNIAQGRP